MMYLMFTGSPRVHWMLIASSFALASFSFSCSSGDGFVLSCGARQVRDDEHGSNGFARVAVRGGAE